MNIQTSCYRCLIASLEVNYVDIKSCISNIISGIRLKGSLFIYKMNTMFNMQQYTQ